MVKTFVGQNKKKVMSGWGAFVSETPPVPGLAEDQPRLTSQEEYAYFRMSTFDKVAEDFLILPHGLSARKFSSITLHPIQTMSKGTRLKRNLTFAYHGFAGPVRWGKIAVEETVTPRGYRITFTWTGYKSFANRWISWKQATSGLYEIGAFGPSDARLRRARKTNGNI